MIPGYAEALRAEQDARDFAFLDMPETISGVDIRQMTCGDFLLLMLLRSPFLCGGKAADAADVAQFLWYLSPGFSTDHDQRTAFLTSIGHLPFDETVQEIRDYLDTTFMDAPGNTPGGPKRPPTTSFVASVVHRLATSYGWTEQDILKVPLVRVYQYLRRIQLEDNPKAVMFNRKSDLVKREYLLELNRPKTNGEEHN